MSKIEDFARILLDLDRCEHGRHEGDQCFECKGPSHGNPHLRPGQVIGYGLGGAPIFMPAREGKFEPSNWRVLRDRPREAE